MKECLIEIKDGTFAYEENRFSIHHINLKINQGEKIAIIGNNGAGKSTFFLTLNGVLRLDGGSLIFRGEQVNYTRKDLLKLRKNVGMVFQDPDNQMIASTVEGEISFGLFNTGMEKSEVRSKVNQVMEQMNLTEYANRPPHYLSGGEKKRVSIADIVVMNPEIILLDEPTASLDCENIEIFRGQIEKLHEEGVTLVISTHDMNFVWEWADRVIVFSSSEVIADDTPNNIFSKDDILKRAALKKPILLGLYEEMVIGGIISEGKEPKTMEDFKDLFINVERESQDE